MARQYIVTEEEMLSLIESLELHRLRDTNLWRDPKDKETPLQMKEDIWRSFHLITVRWVQSIGFSGLRR